MDVSCLYEMKLIIEFQFSYPFLLDQLLTSSTSDRILQVPAQSTISVPLTHTGVQMCLKPINLNNLFQYCTETIDWTIVKKPLEVIENRIACRANHNNIFRYVPNYTQK